MEAEEDLHPPMDAMRMGGLAWTNRDAGWVQIHLFRSVVPGRGIHALGEASCHPVAVSAAIARVEFTKSKSMIHADITVDERIVVFIE